MSQIHPTAILGPEVQLGQDVVIGPYSILDGPVRLGDGVRLGAHCCLSGHTVLGAGVKVYTGANIGDEPQDFGYRGQPTRTEIGERSIIREYVTIHRATVEGGATRIGSDCMLMAFAHVAHDCQVGNRVILANRATLAGHVHVGDRAFLSGAVQVHQFVHIGAFAMIANDDVLRQDVPPYCLVARGGIHGPNTVGLRRAGFAPDLRRQVRESIRLLCFSGLTRGEALERIRALGPGSPELEQFVAFVAASKRGVLPGSGQAPAEGAE